MLHFFVVDPTQITGIKRKKKKKKKKKKKTYLALLYNWDPNFHFEIFSK
jgi:hypothetical protein